MFITSEILIKKLQAFRFDIEMSDRSFTVAGIPYLKFQNRNGTKLADVRWVAGYVGAMLEDTEKNSFVFVKIGRAHV